MEKGTVYKQCSDEEIKNALEESGGLVSPAAKILNISRNALQFRLSKNPELKAFQSECNESTLDLAESKLFKAIEKNESWAISYFLKTQGRTRGYGDEFSVNVNSINANIDLSFDLNRLSVEEVSRLYELITRARLESGDNEPPNTFSIAEKSLRA